MQSAILLRRERPTTRFALPRSTKVAIRCRYQAIPRPTTCSMVPRCVATHRPLLVRGSLSPSQEHQPYLRSPQPASPKVPTCSRALPRVAEKWETFCANKGTFIRKRPTFSRIAQLLCGMARILCCIVLLLLQDCAISFAFPRRTLRTPSNASTPSPIVHPQRPLLLCLPSVNSLSTTIAAP